MPVAIGREQRFRRSAKDCQSSWLTSLISWRNAGLTVTVAVVVRTAITTSLPAKRVYGGSVQRTWCGRGDGPARKFCRLKRALRPSARYPRTGGRGCQTFSVGVPPSGGPNLSRLKAGPQRL